MKNFVKEGQKLPLYGIGPWLILGMGALACVGMVLAVYVFHSGTVTGGWAWAFRAAGVLLILLGLAVWMTGALRSDMDENIAENRLKTDGIYAWVRNPMYSGWWMLITGISFLWHNLWMIPVCLFNWLLMTLVLKRTEEKWLLGLYGQEYTDYMKRVNRCIPWKQGAIE